ncbi:hypothetical protein CO669_00915 [Bradyrhizobium sp. Y36]|uniref:hypothetical protein n=1 Tax=Bradyrhizobium sp. Y36 TaxID=2035447 RepID=UPI000BE83AED|nr:hypothetical protein [Bradyrhizobium sp. Y36]PDT91878.1 hypothetical protein CO669_00915 [Bradyrhizobium sp. Y36]
MRSVGALRRVGQAIAGVFLPGLLVAGCNTADGPSRLYRVQDETQIIRDSLAQLSLAKYAQSDEPLRVKYRNDWLAARMYAIDIQYTEYEAELTKERQAVGFGAAATTLGLTTASTLIAPVATKNILTGLAGVATGTRAAYDNDVLFAHSVQWIQTQMRTQRSVVAQRMFLGMKASTADYPLAMALNDLEEYYRAGTFTGGLLGTSATLGAQAELAELLKQDRIEFTYVSTSTGRALRSCLLHPPTGVTVAVQKSRLLALMPQPSSAGFAVLLGGKAPAAAEDLMQKARIAGYCA